MSAERPEAETPASLAKKAEEELNGILFHHGTECSKAMGILLVNFRDGSMAKLVDAAKRTDMPQQERLTEETTSKVSTR